MNTFDPMLATALDYKRDKDGNPTFEEQQFQWDAQPKLDGIRCVYYFDGEDTRALTRVKGKHTGEYANKINHLPWFIYPTPQTVLDGELIWGKSSRSTMEVLGCESGKALRLQEEHGFVQFHVFDTPFYRGRDVRFLPWERRREFLLEFIDRWSNLHVVREFPARLAWNAGGEGIMLKAPMHQYECGRRSENWLKVKRFRRFIVVVTTFTWGKAGKTGTMLGKMGAIEISMLDHRGILISVGACGTGFSMEERHAGAWPARTVVEVESSDVTEDNKLWHPRFIRRRPDLRVEDASLGQLASS